MHSFVLLFSVIPYGRRQTDSRVCTSLLSCSWTIYTWFYTAAVVLFITPIFVFFYFCQTVARDKNLLLFMFLFFFVNFVLWVLILKFTLPESNHSSCFCEHCKTLRTLNIFITSEQKRFKLNSCAEFRLFLHIPFDSKVYRNFLKLFLHRSFSYFPYQLPPHFQHNICMDLCFGGCGDFCTFC